MCVYGHRVRRDAPIWASGSPARTAGFRLSRERVAEFYRTFYRPTPRLLVVGDVTLEEAGGL